MLLPEVVVGLGNYYKETLPHVFYSELWEICRTLPGDVAFPVMYNKPINER